MPLRDAASVPLNEVAFPGGSKDSKHGYATDRRKYLLYDF